MKHAPIKTVQNKTVAAPPHRSDQFLICFHFFICASDSLSNAEIACRSAICAWAWALFIYTPFTIRVVTFVPTAVLAANPASSPFIGFTALIYLTQQKVQQPEPVRVGVVRKVWLSLRGAGRLCRKVLHHFDPVWKCVRLRF